MLAKKARLPIQSLSVHAVGRITTSYFSVKVFRNTLGHNRFGVIISAKNVKKAARRHELKRRILGRVTQWPGGGKDILFILTQKAEGASKKEINTALQGTRAGVFGSPQ